ncbi:MAG: hypothetical protein AB1646_24485 [Thermodesulfobacteriota bacterium]
MWIRNASGALLRHLATCVAIALCASLAAVLFGAAVSEANPTIMEDSEVGGPTPQAPHPTVRMESEKVTIRLLKDRYAVEGLYLFFNSGASVTEWVGFPERVPTPLASANIARLWFGLPERVATPRRFSGSQGEMIRFEGWVDDRITQFSDAPERFRPLANKYEGFRWKSAQVEFKRDGITVIRVKYEARYSYHPKAVRYIFGTGSQWKDTIGRATFTVDGTEIGGVKSFFAELSDTGTYGTTRRERVSETVVSYELTDFKPGREGKLAIDVYGPPPKGGRDRLYSYR